MPSRRTGRWGLALFAVGSSWRATNGQNCFRMQSSPSVEAPFTDEEIATMRYHLGRNVDVGGTGATLASPELTPALVGSPPYGYMYDWQRDSGLTMLGLLRMADTRIATAGSQAALTPERVDKAASAYVQWVKTVISKNGMWGANGRIDAHAEPKWDINRRMPFEGGWCRPQTDGPAVRAQALMAIANRSTSVIMRREIWDLVTFDLDWLADARNVGAPSCDLWEEVTDGSLFWNRMMMRSALIMGHHVASSMQDLARAQTYLQVAEDIVGNPMADHIKSPTSFGDVIIECQSDAPEDGQCRAKGKNVDGAVLLALIHSGWVDDRPLEGLSLEPASSPTAVAVANTVRAHIVIFCKLYPINEADSNAGVPGVLLGRFPLDTYGGGNPWVLTTAALASLLYQASQVVSLGGGLSQAELDAWRLALNQASFAGTASDFRRAGDSVLLRLKHHVEVDGFHFYEQIHKSTGQQYNAKDLSWSYVEILAALRERDLSMGLASASASASARRLYAEPFVAVESEDPRGRGVQLV